jgi:predicted dehydrogenase
MAARLDGQFELVCGTFSRDPAKSRAGGAASGIDAARSYGSHTSMLAAESKRADGMQAIVIVTPNDSHFAIAKAALEAGCHVLIDKPVTRTHAEALALREVVLRTRRVFGITYTYSGYSIVREARAICLSGRIGAIRKVVVEYTQGWLSGRAETQGSVQAAWRVDPQRAGSGGCIGDIGVHALHLLEFVSGLRVARLRADLSTVLPGRQLDDDCTVIVRLENGAPGLIHASQIATGERNELRLRVFGEAGGLAWSQDAPDRLELRWIDRPTEILYAGRDGKGLGPATRAAARLPVGHPEGFIEALANLYLEFAHEVRRGSDGADRQDDNRLLPGIDEGIRGMRFIEAAVESSRQADRWTQL